MKVAHVRNGEIIRQYSNGKGWVDLEDGSRMSPPVVGTYGNDKIVPVVEETNDTSTGTVDVVITDTRFQVEADRVYRLRTIRDKTQAELEADEDDRTAEDLQRKTGKALFRLANEIQSLKGQAPLTVDQFKNWWKNL